MPDYNAMSLDELRDAKVAIDSQIETLRTEKRVIAAVENKKVAEEEVRKILARLSDDQKNALAQVIKPVGIESAERVNGQ